MPYSRPSIYPAPGNLNSVERTREYLDRLYRALVDNDRTGEQMRDRAPSADLRALIQRPEWHGARRDGTTDDSTAIQAAVNACSSGGTVVFSPGTYLINTKIEIHHPVNLMGAGRETIIKLNAPAWPNNMIFDLESTISTAVNVTDAALTVGQQTITVADGTQFVADQTVLLLYGEDPYDANEEFLRIFLKVKSIAGNDVTFYSGIPEACAAGDVHSLNILHDVVESIRVSGFAFDYGTGTPNNAIRVIHCRNIEIDNIHAIRCPGIFISTNESESVHIRNVYIDTLTAVHASALGFYWWGNRNCSLRNAYGKNIVDRVVFWVESQERNLTIDGCYFDTDNTTKSFMVLYGGSLGIKITNLTVNCQSSYMFDSVAQASQVSYDNVHIYGTQTSIFAENVENRITYGGVTYENPARCTVYFKIIKSQAPFYVNVPAGTYKMARVYVSSATGITGAYLLANGNGGDISTSMSAGAWVTLGGTFYRLGSSYTFNANETKTLGVYTDATVPDDAYGMLEIDYWPDSDNEHPSVLYNRYFINGYGNKIVWGDSNPAGGTWAVGDQCFNISPANGEAFGWICTVAGTPGTWMVMGYLGTAGTPTFSTVTTTSNITSGGNIFVPNGKKVWSKTTGGVENDLVSLWTDDLLYIGYDQNAIILRTNDAVIGFEKARFDQYGNLHVGGTYGIGTDSTKNIVVETGGAPSTSPADKFAMYSADIVAGNAAPHFRTEAGDVVKLYKFVDARASAVANSGDATTDGLIDALRDAMIAQGLIAAS